MAVTFNDIGDDCTKCPFQALGCTGLSNHGNGPSYPPCAELDPDMDLDEYLQKQREIRKKKEEQQKQAAERKAEEQKKKEQAHRRRQFSDRYCEREIKEVKDLKKMKKILENTIQDGEIDLSLMKLMDALGTPIGNVEKKEDNLQMAAHAFVKISNDLDNAKQVLIKKRREAMSTEEYKSIQ